MIHNLLSRIRLDVAKVTGNNLLSTVQLQLQYDVVTGEDDYDPNLPGSRPSVVEVVNVYDHYAFVHFITAEMVVQRGFVEIKDGDAILDLPYDIDLTMTNLRIGIKGQFYAQANTSRPLTEAWDVICQGGATTRSILVSPIQ